MNSYHIVVWPRYSSQITFPEVAASFGYVLREKGYNVTQSSNFIPSKRNIIFGANDCIYTSSIFIDMIPKDAIIVNLEQLSGGNTEWSNETYLNILRTHEVWDYSDDNIEWLKERGVLNIQKINIGYTPALQSSQFQLTQIPPDSKKPIDVLFYGAMNERRAKIINELISHPAKLNIVHSSNLFGEERDTRIFQSKIVLNIHYYPAKILETVRLSHLVANGAFVISEISVNDDELEEWKKYVVFSEYDDIVSTVIKYLSLNRLRFARMAYRNFIEYKQILPMPNASILQTSIDESESESGSGKDIQESTSSNLVKSPESIPFETICKRTNAYRRVKYFYENARDTPSDINEHIETICNYGKRCNIILECGMRSVVSTWAMVMGLMHNDSDKKRLISVDLNYSPRIEEVKALAVDLNIDFHFIMGDDVKIKLEEVDLLFIDTWHVYGHLKRELELHAPRTKKYIILHDTTVDGEVGESIRNGWDVDQQSLTSGYSIAEIKKGLWPAVTEFLDLHTEWYLIHRYTHNNGLTILGKRGKVYPISFSIPSSVIVDRIRIAKTRACAHLIPGKPETYIYHTEQEYYEGYACSYYAITTKKAGWDCLRHYEILANGCIPYFIDLEKCPPQTMTHFPKELVLKAMNLEGVTYNGETVIIDEFAFDLNNYFELATDLLIYTKTYLTTVQQATYILNKSIGFRFGMNVLYLSSDPRPDYMRCLCLHGFKSLFGSNVIDYFEIDHLYDDYGDTSALYGKGFTYSKKLNSGFKNNNQEPIINLIKDKVFDVVIYGSIHRGLPLLDLVKQNYAPDHIIMICGEDNTGHTPCQLIHQFSENICFVREIE